jgi:hypothetical protein
MADASGSNATITISLCPPINEKLPPPDVILKTVGLEGVSTILPVRTEVGGPTFLMTKRLSLAPVLGVFCSKSMSFGPGSPAPGVHEG